MDTAPGARANIIVVEDDGARADLIAGHLRREGHLVILEQDGAACLEYLRAESPGVLILAVMLPDASPARLAARVQSMVRRVAGGRRILVSDDLTVDRGEMTVRVGETPVPLTRAEFIVLEALVERPGHVRSRGQLVARVSGGNGERGHRSIDVHISNLRRKLDDAGGASARIETIVGLGYRLRRAR